VSFVLRLGCLRHNSIQSRFGQSLMNLVHTPSPIERQAAETTGPFSPLLLTISLIVPNLKPMLDPERGNHHTLAGMTPTGDLRCLFMDVFRPIPEAWKRLAIALLAVR